MGFRAEQGRKSPLKGLEELRCRDFRVQGLRFKALGSNFPADQQSLGSKKERHTCQLSWLDVASQLQRRGILEIPEMVQDMAGPFQEGMASPSEELTHFHTGAGHSDLMADGELVSRSSK